MDSKHKDTNKGYGDDPESIGHSLDTEACTKRSSEPTDEEDNQTVVPKWPSKKDASSIMNYSQHKVFSLKDYSQVASPSVETKESNPSNASSSKLLKSFSQDRKSKMSTKRLSECIYSPNQRVSITSKEPKGTKIPTTSAFDHYSKQSDPSVANQVAMNSFPAGPAGSINSILNNSNPRHAALLSESRMDRVKKLFVSPLSLRSATTNSAGKPMKPDAYRGATQNQRLSLQSSGSGTSMLNKPHHLMHAVYRSRAGIPHYRRSPMRQKQGKSFRVYGCPLKLANNIYPITCFGRPDIYKQQAVPYILARLCNYIEENSSRLTHEGIFRVSGNARLMDKLRNLFDHLGDAPLELESVDVATSASMLKMYLRELPEPLIPTRMNYYFISLAKKYSSYLSNDNSTGSLKLSSGVGFNKLESSSTSNSDLPSDNHAMTEHLKLSFVRDLTKLLRKLPIENYNLLKYLTCFLFRISLKQQYNKMCAEALGIVFGPNIFRIRSESYKGLKEQELTNQIMSSIIGNYRSIFDPELTDPLGNIVNTSEDMRLDHEFINELSNKTTEKPRANQASSDNIETPSTSNVDSSSENQANSISLKANQNNYQGAAKTHLCCSRQCRANYMDEKDELNHDDEDDEEESYTPTTDSDSYCSSMDSQTLDSSYDDRDGTISYRTDDDQCVSVTSYTPSSSHSETDETQDDNSSSHESNHGSRKGRYRSCLMCKRQEANRLHEADEIETKKADIQHDHNSKGVSQKTNPLYRHDILRRRSSSASSLARIGNLKHKFPTSTSQNHHHESDISHYTKYRPQSDRRKFQDSSRNRMSSKKSHNRSHSSRRYEHSHQTHEGHHSKTRSSRIQDERSMDQVFCDHERIPAFDLQAYARENLGLDIDLLTTGYFDDRDGERFFLLRSFNSDETLLRSLNYCPDFAPEPKAKSTRRLSGFRVEEKMGPSSMFHKVPDTIRNNEDLCAEPVANIPFERQDYSSCIQSSSSICAPDQTFPSYGTSTVSLLDNQLPNFRRSELSINEFVNNEDPILTQMNAMKSLIKALKVQLRKAQETGRLSVKVEQVLLKMDKESDLSDYSDDCLSCYIDYLSARELAKNLCEWFDLDSSDGVQKIKKLNSILNIKITLFKQRYNDLKNIYDHCIKNHSSALVNFHERHQTDESLIDREDDLRSTSSLGTTGRNKTISLDGPSTSMRLSRGSKSSQSIPKNDNNIKHLSESKLKQPEIEKNQASDDKHTESGCHYGSLCPIEFVYSIEKQLATKRIAGSRCVKVHDMTVDQLQDEKLELQKNLLRYEHWFGRPVTRLEFSFVGHLYERYRAIKIIKAEKASKESS